MPNVAGLVKKAAELGIIKNQVSTCQIHINTATPLAIFVLF